MPLAALGGLFGLLMTGLDHQHLQPDRPDHPGRHRHQERHPDRRVRQSAARRGIDGARGGDRGGGPAPAPDHHDLDRRGHGRPALMCGRKPAREAARRSAR
ncbi:hypothetical protein ACRAWD_19435 [Caulobacter segnis]